MGGPTRGKGSKKTDLAYPEVATIHVRKVQLARKANVAEVVLYPLGTMPPKSHRLELIVPAPEAARAVYPRGREQASK